MDRRQIFCLPDEMPEHVVIALQHPKLYANKVKDVGGSIERPVQCASCSSAVTFTEDNLLWGSEFHNHPLFVTGYIRKQKVKRILSVDGRSAINIMSKSKMNDLGITMEELSKSRTMIQGFNLEGQRAIIMIRNKLIVGDLSTSSIFYIINAKTSECLLLGRP